MLRDSIDESKRFEVSSRGFGPGTLAAVDGWLAHGVGARSTAEARARFLRTLSSRSDEVPESDGECVGVRGVGESMVGNEPVFPSDGKRMLANMMANSSARRASASRSGGVSGRLAATVGCGDGGAGLISGSVFSMAGGGVGVGFAVIVGAGCGAGLGVAFGGVWEAGAG